MKSRAGSFSYFQNDAMETHHRAAGFSFHTQIFTLDWGPSLIKRETFVTRYTERTQTMWDRRKNVILPARVQPGTVWTHDYHPVKGFGYLK